jgi:dimethylamine/trimethylamine dehydrogenase
LFDPVQIGPKTLRNRFVQVPHCTHFGVDFPLSQAAHRAVKADGGWALVQTEYCSIHPESDDYPHNFARLWDETDVANLRLLCDEVHRFGALAGVELWYGSIEALNLETRMPARGVMQQYADEVLHHAVYGMTTDEIHELQDFYVAAALRAVEAGFDVINVYAGHFHTITHQFMTPYYNRRTDEYGGSLENRVRFLHETIVKIRQAVGDSCAIGVRFGFESLRGDAGITADVEGYRIIAMLDDLVDYWDLMVGTFSNWNVDSAPSSTHAEGYNAEWMREVKRYTKKPVMGIGRYVSPDKMIEAIRNGELDIIGAARPSIADPFLPKKIEEGRFEDIRECIGCNMCIGHVWGLGSRIVCTQNATAGEEYRRGWHPELFTRAGNADLCVLVVGAGPAGMECARVLGERGMNAVHLVDEGDRLGGAVNWISRMPGLGEWHRLVDWRQGQLDKLPNVQTILGRSMSADDVLGYGADLVVVGTGSTWNRNGHNPIHRADVPGAATHSSRVFTPEDIMRDGRAPADGPVVVYDMDGYYTALSIAEKLASDGLNVTVVTPEPEAGGFLRHTGEFDPVHQRLLTLRVAIRSYTLMNSVESDHVVVHSTMTRAVDRLPAAAVVMVTQRDPNSALYEALTADPTELRAAGIVGVFRAGDCWVPRKLVDAVFDGHRLGREIDSDNPAQAKPFRRERLVVPMGTTLPAFA